jgi:hypothetical protein
MKKSIYIHVGPPKTGTSILQSWLMGRSEQLLAETTIYYPKHDTDQNQVSSGHNQLFLETKVGHKTQFNHKKFSGLLDDFELENKEILLLSSEYFFYQIPEFIKYVNKYQIQFIAYVRPEFEFIESIYNQSVKRNRQNMPMPMRKEIRYSYLDTLLEYISTFGTQYFQLRADGVRNFFEPNIIADFLSLFRLEALMEENLTVPIINSSYCFECLEFKRWINNFDIAELDDVLDKKLQSYNSSEQSYSLIPQQIYLDYKRDTLQKISTLNKICTIANYQKLAAYINQTTRPAYMHQELHDTHLVKVLNFLLDQDLEFSQSLFSVLCSQENLTSKDEARISIFRSELKSHSKSKRLFRNFLKKLTK